MKLKLYYYSFKSVNINAYNKIWYYLQTYSIYVYLFMYGVHVCI